jgi:hypothetical protein
MTLQYGATGGWNAQQINPSTTETVIGALNQTTQGANGELDNIINGELVYYSTQVVAGINHAIVFKGSNGQFTCFRLWEKLDQTFEITDQGSASTLTELGPICNIGSLN